MSQVEPALATSDQRLMAALAHFFGLIAALVIWATQKDKSPFLRFQALQALAFDVLLTAVFLVLTLCVMGVMFVGVLVLVAATKSTGPQEGFISLGVGSMLLPMGVLFCLAPVSWAALLIRTIAAISVANGRNFRYPFIAGRVKAFLGGSGIH